LLVVMLQAAEKASALPLSPGWVETKRVPSEYATQAAAADAKHFYAVSNTHVGRYDRATGKLLAAATAPDCKHLNSAAFRKGKLYCAHSNYPTTPEQSDIRVYDPAADTLKVFHTFVKPPGSLVWCVRDPADKFWWCCFAHYGDANGQTFLAKMDDEFKELRRWAFPPKVIADWDAMSASGGLWETPDTLLVSHHHFRVLYRLKLPKAGDTLELVAALTCPFPGQGIATDPATPAGLVGIDRPKRAVVFAKPAK
jgi:hypothetical protein